MSLSPSSVVLSNSVSMPLVQLGTFKTKGTSTVLTSISAALDSGYTAIDTAAVYNNHQDIALALDSELARKGMDRKQLFITSKLHPRDHGRERCGPAIDRAMQELGVAYLDLFLIHWPGVGGVDVSHPSNKTLRSESWEVLENYYLKGTLKSIGVSNYTIDHLEELLSHCNIVPHILQIELHPHFQQPKLAAFCEQKGIHIQAYSSLGQIGPGGPLFKNDVVIGIAKNLERSPAQVLLKWGLQHGYTILPKSTSPKHIQENIQLNFDLSEADMSRLDNLEMECGSKKYAWDPTKVL